MGDLGILELRDWRTGKIVSLFNSGRFNNGKKKEQIGNRVCKKS